MRKSLSTLIALGIILGGVTGAMAADIPILAKKLLIVDTIAKNGKSKVVLVAKDAGIDKGAAGDPAMLDGEVEIFYTDTPSNGTTYALPSPWKTNSTKVAKFLNTSAPAAISSVKISLVKPDKLLKLVAKSKDPLGMGGLGIDITNPPGAGGVTVAYTLNNGNDGSSRRMCARFSVGDGSRVLHRIIASGQGYRLLLKDGVGVPCPDDCTDGVQNGTETDVDCGGGCPMCGPGDSCLIGSDCTSLICSLGTCTTPTCFDGVQNQGESDVDCGGPCGATCNLGESCGGAGDCSSGTCSGGVCTCGNKVRVFSLSSNGGGAFDSAEWPGGSQSHNFSPGCGVTINNPGGNIDLVCSLNTNFNVQGWTGFSSCTGGSCNVTSCPPAGIGSCCEQRPSCSAALNGSGSATYTVTCTQ